MTIFEELVNNYGFKDLQIALEGNICNKSFGDVVVIFTEKCYDKTNLLQAYYKNKPFEFPPILYKEVKSVEECKTELNRISLKL